ncbi:flavodoxin family protein [Ochrobactrum teleogrylli]|uniref:flavodoxin family protein n=1 Tax=Ochrobactrum teleogrylli TaxID=2479765 RepID=UPI0015E024C2|nr:flavodoxin family protein [[Ochrobactrum] teleogrylli]
MKALILSGSERGNGIASAVSKRIKVFFSEKGVNSEIISLCHLNYSACNNCGEGKVSCNYRSSACEKQDDMPEVIKKMIGSDIVVYVCPVHAFGMGHLMQIFLERAGVGYLRFTRPLINKIGCPVVIGRKYNLGHVHDQLVNNMLLNRMVVPGAGFPVLIHGNEETKEIADPEEKVALEQLLLRSIEIANSITACKAECERPNERIIKYNYIESFN